MPASSESSEASAVLFLRILLCLLFWREGGASFHLGTSGSGRLAGRDLAVKPQPLAVKPEGGGGA